VPAVDLTRRSKWSAVVRCSSRPGSNVTW
jgi:hypothetical protein